MKRTHIKRKKAIIFGCVTVSIAAALIPKVVKAVKCRKYSSPSF